MRAYWYDNKPVCRVLHASIKAWLTSVQGDQREPHDSGRDVSVEELSKLGVLYYHFPQVEQVDKMAAEREYKNRDVITVSPEAMGPVYEDKVKMFFNEHLHEDEEIRYILEGNGFFDVRNEGDEWIRIRLDAHDALIMPAGVYHRFTTDEKNVCGSDSLHLYKTLTLFQKYIRAMRLFRDEPRWTPLNRGPEVDNNQYRKEYLQSRGSMVK
jgi:1,2-dihydroxy-3-keto-5-methylthiopentene dioxygenase